MDIQLTLKLNNGKKLKLSDSEARNLREMLNKVYGTPPSYYWYTPWWTTEKYTFNNGTLDFSNWNTTTTSASDYIVTYNVSSGELEGVGENIS